MCASSSFSTHHTVALHAGHNTSYLLKTQCHNSSIWWISLLYLLYFCTPLFRGEFPTSFQPQHCCLRAPYLPISVSFIGALQMQILCSNCLFLSLLRCVLHSVINPLVLMPSPSTTSSISPGCLSSLFSVGLPSCHTLHWLSLSHSLCCS